MIWQLNSLQYVLPAIFIYVFWNRVQTKQKGFPENQTFKRWTFTCRSCAVRNETKIKLFMSKWKCERQTLMHSRHNQFVPLPMHYEFFSKTTYCLSISRRRVSHNQVDFIGTKFVQCKMCTKILGILFCDTKRALDHACHEPNTAESIDRPTDQWNKTKRILNGFLSLSSFVELCLTALYTKSSHLTCIHLVYWVFNRFHQLDMDDGLIFLRFFFSSFYVV